MTSSNPLSSTTTTAVRDLDKSMYDASTVTSREVSFTSAQLFRHLRQEELLAYRHVLRAFAMANGGGGSASFSRTQTRVLEDLRETLAIPDERHAAELQAAGADHIVSIISSRGIAAQRDRFCDSYNDVDGPEMGGSDTDDAPDEDVQGSYHDSRAHRHHHHHHRDGTNKKTRPGGGHNTE
eukprot:PhM_4_TR17903/c0_g1_i1/m.64803